MFIFRNRIIDVIKYEGPADVFIWKHECEDFNTKSQLIVHESQEAVFCKDGQILDTFPAGRYTLDTQNIPLLRKVIGLPTGGVTPFHCEVYYINKAVSMGLEWGTDSPIRMEDPEYKGLTINIRAYGEFSLCVIDGRKLLVKLVGMVPVFSQEGVLRCFSGIMASHIRAGISSTLEKNKISGLRVDTQLVFISGEIEKQLAPVFEEYGLELKHFIIEGMNVNGLEKLGGVKEEVIIGTIKEKGKADIERLKMNVDAERIQMEGAARNAVKLGEGSVEAQVNQLKGISEQQRLAFETAKELASNTGPTGSVGFGGSIQSPAGFASDIVKTVMRQPTVYNTGSDDFAERLNKLEMMHDKGMLTEEEYQRKRKEIIDSI